MNRASGSSHPVGVSRSVLGRGLGQLLRDPRLAQRVVSAGKPAGTAAAPGLDPGLRALLEERRDGQPVNPFAPPRPGTNGSPSGQKGVAVLLLKTSLVAGDAALCGVVGLMVWRAAGGLSALELASCVMALSLGAWLSCLAVLWPPEG